MAVRTVSVLLTADIAAFRARMADASRSANRTSRSIRASMRNAGRAMVRVGENQRTALKMVRGASLGLVAAFGFAVAASAKFEQSMAQVRAVTQASAGQMGQLRAAALEAGRTTAYSASQAAEAEFELAKAGIQVADITGGALKGSLNLAAAAQIDLSEAAEISATTMTVFGLKGKDVTHIADVLAAAANKSATDVHQLGLSFKMTAQVAAQTGLSLEDTTGAMALFASEGLKGSDAGTSFKVMLQRLTPQSQEAQATMDRLGFSAYDADGNFVGLEETARRMKAAFSGLTPEARNAAMGVIFGSDAVRAAGILYKNGAEGVRTYTDAVNDQGYAAAVAQTKMDHLIGDLQLLKSALETALIESGSAANSALRDMVQWVTRLVNIYNGLPPGVQRAAGVMTGMVGVIGLVGASILLLLPRVMTVRRELRDLGVTAARTRSAMLLMAKTGAVIGGLLAISYAVQKVRDQFKDAPPDVAKLTNSMVDFARKGKASGELAARFGEDLDGLGEAVKRIAHPSGEARATDIVNSLTLDLTKGLMEAQIPLDEAHDKLNAIDESLAELVASGHSETAAENFKAYARAANEAGTSTDKFRTLLPKYTAGLASSDTQAKLAAEGQGDLAEALGMTKQELDDQRTSAEKLADALDALNGININAAEANIDFQGSLRDLTETVKENGHSLDITTEKGSKVKGAFLDAAKAAMKHAEAVADQKGSVEAGNAVLEQNIGALRRTMKQAGFTDKQINDLIGTYARLPAKESTTVDAPGAVKAAEEVNALYYEVADLQPGKTIDIKAPTGKAIKALQAAGYKVKKIPGSKKVRITAPTGTAQANARALKSEIDKIRSKSVTISAHVRYTASHIPGPLQGKADGGIVGRAQNGLYIPGYAPRRDTELILASKGEGVLVPETVRALGQLSGLGSKGIIDALNRWGRSGALMPARMFPARDSSTATATAPPAQYTSYTINARTADFTVRDLDRVQRVQEARARVGRPQ